MSGIFTDSTFVGRWAVRLAIVWIALLYFRVAWVSSAELEAGDLERQSGHVHAAIAHYRRSARHAAPPFGASSKALDHLFEIGEAAERARDTETALAAYRSIRGSIVAVRPLGTFLRDRLEVADEHIAGLVARGDRSATLRDRSRDAVRRMHRRLLQDTPRERWLGLLLTALGFVLFVASAHELVSRGVDLDDRPIREVVMRATLSLVVGFGMFVVGLLVT